MPSLLALKDYFPMKTSTDMVGLELIRGVNATHLHDKDFHETVIC